MRTAPVSSRAVPFLFLLSVFINPWIDPPASSADASQQGPRILLRAAPGNGSITLSWEVSADPLPWGFNVYRHEGARAGVSNLVNQVPLRGGKEGRFVDTDLQNGKPCYYRITTIDSAGVERWADNGVWMRPARLPGDVTGDVDSEGLLRVDGFDLIRLMASFGRARGDSGYDESCDLNGDGKVDGVDLDLVSSNLGRREKQ